MRNYVFKVKTIKKMPELKKAYKVCTNCKKLLPIRDFNKAKGRKGQRTFESRCRKCKYELSKVIKICEVCGKEYSTQRKGQVCCSNECASKLRITKIHTKCEYCGKEYNVKKSRYENMEHHFCSKKCFYDYQSEYLSGENSPHWNFDLTEEERSIGRKYPEYYKWVNDVFKRDSYTCQCCDSKKDIRAHHLNGYNWDKEHRTDVNNGITLCDKCHKEFHKRYGTGDNTKEQFEDFIKEKCLEIVLP